MAKHRYQLKGNVTTAPRTAANHATAVAAKLGPSAPPAPSETPIVREKMVDWYDPMQLAGTAIQVAISTIFGRHSDYRVLEALANSSDKHLFFDHTYRYSLENGEYSIDC